MVQTMVRPSAPGGGARVEILCMWSFICHIYAVPISLFRAATVTVVPYRGRPPGKHPVISPAGEIPSRVLYPRTAGDIPGPRRGYPRTSGDMTLARISPAALKSSSLCVLVYAREGSPSGLDCGLAA
jgi:hypothetical protein